MNILALEDGLKSISDQDLVKELRGPTGLVPQFMVLTELNRRKDIRQSFMASQAQPESTIAEEFAGATGGLGNAALGMQQPVTPAPPPGGPQMAPQGPQGALPIGRPGALPAPPGAPPSAPQMAPQVPVPTQRPPGMAEGGEVEDQYAQVPGGMLSDADIAQLLAMYRGESRDPIEYPRYEQPIENRGQYPQGMKRGGLAQFDDDDVPGYQPGGTVIPPRPSERTPSLTYAQQLEQLERERAAAIARSVTAPPFMSPGQRRFAGPQIPLEPHQLEMPQSAPTPRILGEIQDEAPRPPSRLQPPPAILPGGGPPGLTQLNTELAQGIAQTATTPNFMRPRPELPSWAPRMDIEGAQAEPGAIPFQPYTRDTTVPGRASAEGRGRDADLSVLERIRQQNQEPRPRLRESETTSPWLGYPDPSIMAPREVSEVRRRVENLASRATQPISDWVDTIARNEGERLPRSAAAEVLAAATQSSPEYMAYAGSTGDPTELPRYATPPASVAAPPIGPLYPGSTGDPTELPRNNRSSTTPATPNGGAAQRPRAGGGGGGTRGGGVGGGGRTGPGGGIAAGASVEGGTSDRQRNFEDMQRTYGGNDSLGPIRDQIAADRAELARERDRAPGMAIMRAGLGIMASRSPYLGVAVGEGGQAGLDSFQQQREIARRAGREMTGQQAQLAQAEMQDRRALQQLSESGLQNEYNRTVQREQIAAQLQAARISAGARVGPRDPVDDARRLAEATVDPNLPPEQRAAAIREAIRVHARGGAQVETAEMRREQAFDTIAAGLVREGGFQMRNELSARLGRPATERDVFEYARRIARGLPEPAAATPAASGRRVIDWNNPAPPR